MKKIHRINGLIYITSEEEVNEGVIENEYLVEVKELENGEFELVGFTKK